jgi:methylthioribose-1-phosphate isomerase
MADLIGAAMQPAGKRPVKRPTLWLTDGRVITLDQTALPFEKRRIELSDWRACAQAISSMQVRGAPLIGVVAAFGLALGLRQQASAQQLAEVKAALLATRPTAVNLAWALNRVEQH